MKTILFSLCTVFLSVNAWAQQEPKQDTIKIEWGKITAYIIGDSLKKDSLKQCEKSGGDERVTMAMEIGVNGYLSADHNLSLPDDQQLMEVDYARSRSFGLMMMFRALDVVEDRFYLSSGVGVNWNNYRFKNNSTVSASNDSTMFVEDSISYNKYKLRTTYLQVPLMLGVKIGKLNRPLGIQVGVIGGLRLSSVIKQKYQLETAAYDTKINDDFNLSPFKLDATARVGIGDFGVFARYSLTSLFEKGKAPELIPFQLGISFGGFFH